jgi:hypothetical protein
LARANRIDDGSRHDPGALTPWSILDMSKDIWRDEIARRMDIALPNPVLDALLDFWLKKPFANPAIESIVEYLPRGDSRWNWAYLKAAVENQRIQLLEDHLDAQEGCRENVRIDSPEIANLAQGIGRPVPEARVVPRYTRPFWGIPEPE